MLHATALSTRRKEEWPPQRQEDRGDRGQDAPETAGGDACGTAEGWGSMGRIPMLPLMGRRSV
jgi:hypothetical protein